MDFTHLSAPLTAAASTAVQRDKDDETTPQPDETSASAADRRATPALSIVIPTYNERKNIERVLEQCLDAFGDTPVEIVVVDDDSPDGTWELVQQSYRDDDHVRVIRRTEESGLATAVLRGFEAADAERYAVIDADLQHPPERLTDLLAALRQPNTDVAIGSRYVDGGDIENWSRRRQIVSKGAIGLAKVAVPSAWNISDPMSGFFAVEADVVDGVDLQPRGYKILLEILATCDYDGVVEVPYVFTDRDYGESNLDGEQYLRFLEHLGMVGVTSWGLDDYVEPDRAVRAAEFCGVGALGVLVNAAVFWAATEHLGVFYLVAGVLAFLAAVQWNFAGNWFLTFDRPDDQPILSQWSRFHVVSIAGFLVYSLLLAGFVDGLGVSAQVANLGAIAGASVWNFLGSESVAFKSA
ncbi:glycosyltransferase [Halospeciosus flavus]|uniref:Glycosyltransferase n=1 Tax=Halospeciosus flavus TaxID=3032283 RepID=A0ABD5Z348_9EURY|nr:glycosyltransferase family 2 protein [Halospeciosus flavus]